MKKFSVCFLMLCLVVSILCPFASSAANVGTILQESDSFKVETTFNPPELKPNQLFTAKVVASSTPKESYEGVIPVLVIVGLYNNNNTMVNVSYISKDLVYQGTEELSAGFKLPSDLTGHKVRVFMWDGSDLAYSNMTPISNVVELAYDKVIPTPTPTVTATPPPTPSVIPQDFINLDESWNGKTLYAVKNHPKILLNLYSNLSTGYQWQYTQEPDSTILKQFDHRLPTPTSNPPKVGEGGIEQWSYLPVGIGTTTFELVYARPWESVPPLKTFKFTVVVEDRDSPTPTVVLTPTPAATVAPTPSIIPQDFLNADESWNGKTLYAVKNHPKILLNLYSNPTTGYQWQYTQEPDSSVLKQLDHTFLQSPASNPPKDGEGGTERWTFVPVDTGTTTFELMYARPWESVPPLKTFKFTVVVE